VAAIVVLLAGMIDHPKVGFLAVGLPIPSAGLGHSRTADPPNSPPQTSTSLLRQEHCECKIAA
jgi:hypothetical protein